MIQPITAKSSIDELLGGAHDHPHDHTHTQICARRYTRIHGDGHLSTTRECYTNPNRNAPLDGECGRLGVMAADGGPLEQSHPGNIPFSLTSHGLFPWQSS